MTPRSRLSLVGLLTTLLAWGSAMASERVEVIDLPSRAIAAPAAVTVALPEGYDADASHGYPTVYLLNGFGGDNTDYSRKFDLGALATAHGIIIVCPDGRNSWYWDSPVLPEMQMETFITAELVPAIDSLYHTIPTPKARAITGLSMGGHGAFWLAMRHPDIWGAMASMSGGLDVVPFAGRWNTAKVLGPANRNPQRWADHSCMSLLDTVIPGRQAIYFDCGEQDFFYDVNCRMDSTLTARGIPHTFTHRPGAHSWDYWTVSLPAHLDFFSTFFAEQ